MTEGQGTNNPEKGTSYPDLLAIDFGDNSPGSLAIHGAQGPVERPKIKFSRDENGEVSNFATAFIGILAWALAQGPVVVESATVGSSGAEPEQVRDLVAQFGNPLWEITTRAVKNHRADAKWNGVETEKSHIDDARVIYEIATSTPARLKRWTYVPLDSRLHRKYRSVRPHDKREYQGPIPDYFMSLVPPFGTLGASLQVLFGDKQQKGYLRAKVMPFAMALEEAGSDTRAGYERVIGLYEHGYPSFYRRNTIDVFQRHCKHVAGVTSMKDVEPRLRKQEWSRFRRKISRVYHLCQGTVDPEMGTPHPDEEMSSNGSQGTVHPEKGTADPG